MINASQEADGDGEPWTASRYGASPRGRLSVLKRVLAEVRPSDDAASRVPVEAVLRAEERLTDRPRELNEVGDEPDPRFTLANERTFLAWTRTALGLLVTGLAVSEFLDSQPRAARLVISVPLILMACVIGLVSYPRWRMLERALRLSQPLPYAPAAAPLGIAIALVAVAAVVVLATG
jgi:putative membrane protein